MSSRTIDEGRLTRLYRERIGEPETVDEAVGYWIFFIGALAGVLGIALFLVTSPARTSFSLREASIVLAAAGLLFLLAGPVIRLPLRPAATYLSYAGVVVAVVAIIWFMLVFPAGWDSQASGNVSIIGLYTLGVALVAAAGLLVPLIAGRVDADELMAETEAAREARAAAERERDETAAELDSMSEQVDALADERTELESDLAALRQSQATFELYEDAAGEYRWRLRHRNGNVVADSGEGYTARHNAQNGIESVRRNALGAGLLEIPAAAEAEPDPIPEESQATFETYEDSAGEHRWRLVHDNGEILADGGEGYASKYNVERAVAGVKTYAGPADYLRIDPTAFEVYQDADEEWRWRLLHRNGQILADSGEGYASRRNARRAVETVQDAAADGDYEVYADDAGEHRWRLVAGNGEVIADSGEGYGDEGGAEDAVDRMGEYAPDANTLDLGLAAFEIYEDAAGEYRWRLRHRNGEVIADGGEGYAERNKAVDAVESVKRNAPGAALAE
ncbi:MAG: HVO_2922 family protein [Haloarculaceae archaeon]